MNIVGLVVALLVVVYITGKVIFRIWGVGEINHAEYSLVAILLTRHPVLHKHLAHWDSKSIITVGELRKIRKEAVILDKKLLIGTAINQR